MKIMLPLMMLPLCLATACVAPADADSTASETDDLAVPHGPNGFGALRLSNTNLCVQPSVNSDGARLQLTTCNSGALQHWLFATFPGTSDFRIFNQASGLCIYNSSEPTQNGGSVVQGGCNIFGTTRPVSNAKWRPSSQSGFASLQSELNGNPGFCIDVPGGNAFNGALLQMFRCNGSPAQVFIIQ